MRKLIKANKLIEFPIQMVNESDLNPYSDTHVIRDSDGKYKIIAGRNPPTNSRGSASVVYHGELTMLQILALQMILSYASDLVPNVNYRCQLVRILASVPTVTWNELSHYVCMSEDRIVKLLNIRPDIYKHKSICVSNAYVLSKYKGNIDRFILRAKMMNPVEFTPLIHHAVRKQKEQKC